MRPPRLYALFGLTVASEIPLPAVAHPDDPGNPDLFLRWGQGDPPEERAFPEILAHLEWGTQRVYTLRRGSPGFLLVFPHCCTVWFSRDLQWAKVWPQDQASLDSIGQILVGSVPVTVLTLQGHWTLHASAVVMEGRAIGIVGDTGSGKSTLAFALCTLGAQLLTDDVLRVAWDSSGVAAFAGTGWLRLRRDVAQRARKWVGSTWRSTPDGRVAVLCPPPASIARVVALVLPEVGSPLPGLQPLSPPEALVNFTPLVKLRTLQEKEFLSQRLNFLAQVVQRVPVYRLRIPWNLGQLENHARRVMDLLASFQASGKCP